MKRLLIITFLFMAALLGCTSRSHIKVSPPRIVLLPEDSKGHLPRPYEVDGKRYYPLPDAYGFVQVGTASWYGRKFHGRPTASGEIFDMHRRTAAHKTLPLGTYVKVINLSNGRSTVVRINDRGPFIKDRIIDLSYAAAKDIGLLKDGLARVKIVALSKEVGVLKHDGRAKPIVEIPEVQRGEFTIQVGAFVEMDNALRLAERLKVLFEYVEISRIVDQNMRTVHRVHVSRSKSLTQAEDIKKRLKEMGFAGAFIVRI
ncbi:MAG: septal ring lytic transglycosylase RlpA family protein [Deltaproteobacteria bacterium]|nr:septal ring lytic transglycosylase RlpA family protein [Deltaproteobacteria bacterium]